MSLTLLLISAFCIALLGTGAWRHLARRCGWFDLPNQRSSHTRPTLKSGGAGFVLAYSLYVLYLHWTGQVPLVLLLLIGLGLIPAAMGFADDLRNLGIISRIGLQLLAVILALALLWPLPALVLPFVSLPAPWLLPLLVMACVWLINLFNFMDGIDALAAAEAIFFGLALALFASFSGNTVVLLSGLGLAVAVGGFLVFNIAPAQVFMGDLGSNYLGYMAGALGLLAVATGAVNYWTLAALLGIFIVDASTTLLERIGRGLVWYHAHRSHAYQIAARRYRSHGSVVLACCFINLCWLLPLSWLTLRFDDYGLPLVILAWSPLAVIGWHYRHSPEEGG